MAELNAYNLRLITDDCKSVYWRLDELCRNVTRYNIGITRTEIELYTTKCLSFINENSIFHNNFLELLQRVDVFSQTIHKLDEITEKLSNKIVYNVSEECMIEDSVKMNNDQKTVVSRFVKALRDNKIELLQRLQNDMEAYLQNNPNESERGAIYTPLIKTCNEIVKRLDFITMRVLNYHYFTAEEKNDEKIMNVEEGYTHIMDMNMNCQHPPVTRKCKSVSLWRKLLVKFKRNILAECSPDEECFTCKQPMANNGTNYAIQESCTHKFCVLCYENYIFYNSHIGVPRCPQCREVVTCWTTRNHYNAALNHRALLMAELSMFNSSGVFERTARFMRNMAERYRVWAANWAYELDREI